MRTEIKPIEVSEEDGDLLINNKWFIGKGGYAVRNVSTRERRKAQEYLHRLVAKRMGLDMGSGRCVDHVDRNKLNNRRDNLRSCTRSENLGNNGCLGVSWDSRRRKWRARLNKDGKEVWFARFDNLDEAIRARRVKQVEFLGEFAPCEAK